MTTPDPKEPPRLFDSPRFHDQIFYGLLVSCGALLLVDFVPGYHKHTHFDFEGWYGFYALFGFLAYVSIVNCAKAFRKLVKRREDYYD